MGGTSCDVALIRDGEPLLAEPRQDRRPRPRRADAGHQHGQRRRRHHRDASTASACSQVGPHSAGAVPGPACYGRGGKAPTITDCNLVLGYLERGQFPRRPDAARCRRARAPRSTPRWRARSACAWSQAAEGIIRIIDVKMQEAIKAISTMRGHDLRDFMLLAFGGAGPAACRRASPATSAWPA